jgi:hypothetical protein
MPASSFLFYSLLAKQHLNPHLSHEQASCFCTLPRTRYCCHCSMLSISSCVSFFCIIAQGFCLPNLVLLVSFFGSDMSGHFFHTPCNQFLLYEYKFMLNPAVEPIISTNLALADNQFM